MTLEVPEGFWRSTDGHKYSTGRLLVVAGSKGLLGAGCLTARAAIAGGCGAVRWVVPESLSNAAAGLFLDGWVHPLTDGGCGHLLATHGDALLAFNSQALVLGPGLGLGSQQGGLVQTLVSSFDGPLVLDADGLTLMTSSLEVLKDRSAATVLTPHEGEMARLLEVSIEEIQQDRHRAAAMLRERTGAVVVLKGPDTVVEDGASSWKNTLNSAFLATAGTGDVLAGLLGSLLARGLEAGVAARFAVQWHGRAGQVLEEICAGPQGLGATSLLDALLEVQQNGFQ